MVPVSDPQELQIWTIQGRSQQALLSPHLLYRLQTARRDTLLKLGAK